MIFRLVVHVFLTSSFPITLNFRYANEMFFCFCYRMMVTCLMTMIFT